MRPLMVGRFGDTGPLTVLRGARHRLPFDAPEACAALIGSMVEETNE